MFEVTVARLETIAAIEMAIASTLIAKASVDTVATLGAASPELVAASAAFTAAQAAMVAEGAAIIALEGMRGVIIASALTVGGIGSVSAGQSAALVVAVAGTA